MRTWIYPGSFDPPTLGHEDIIRRAARLCDELVVAVMENTRKSASFTVAQRTAMLKTICDPIENVKVVTSDGLQKDLYQALHACAVVRGVRNGSDMEYETQMVRLNQFLLEGYETVLLLTQPGLEGVSSSYARELMHFGSDYERLLPQGVIDYIKNVYMPELTEYMRRNMQ